MAKLIKKRWVRAVLGMVFFFIAIIVLLLLALQTPYVQTKVVKKISKVITQKTGFYTSLDYFSIRWFDIAEVEGVKIYDTDGNLMLDFPSITIDFELNSLLYEEDKKLDLIEVWKGKAYLIKTDLNDSMKTINVDLFLKNVKKAFLKKNKKGSKAFGISELSLIGCQIKYHDPSEDSLSGKRFDYHHFVVKDITADISEVYLHADTVSMVVGDLSAIDSLTSLEISSMKTHFRLTKSSMEFQELQARIGKSFLSDTLRFEFEHLRDLGDFNSKVNMYAHLNQTELHTDDIALFAPSLYKYNDKFEINGLLEGKVSSFTMKDFDLSFGNSTEITGKINMFGLPQLDETFVDLNMVNSTINIHDLQKYISGKSYNALAKLEQFGFNGQFTGYQSDFVAKGDFVTKYGRALLDINLKVADNINNSNYSGTLNTSNFRLGAYFGREDILQKVTVNGKIEGSGLTFENADFNLEGNIKSIGFYDYNYKNITTNARFAKELFEGKLSIDDPNLQFVGEGAIDLRDGRNAYNITAKLDTLQLKALNLSDKEIFIGAHLDIDAEGLQLDSITGTAHIRDLNLNYDGREFHVDSLQVLSNYQQKERNLSLLSSLAQLDIHGDFQLTSTFRDLKELFNEYRLNINNDRKRLAAYYREKAARKHQAYNLSYEIQLREMNTLLELLSDSTYISPNTILSGNFSGGYTTIFSLNTVVDSIYFNNTSFFNTEIDISSSKIADSTNVLAIGYILSEKQGISEVFKTKNLIAEAIWNNEHIDFKFDAEQDGLDNYVKLGGNMDFLKDRTQISLLPSDLRILDKDWQFSENNLIEIIGNEVSVDSLVLFHAGQRLALDGEISQDESSPLRLIIDDFRLENLNPIIDRTLSGLLNGEVTINNYYNDLRVENSFELDTFKINDFLVGDISGSSHWNNDRKDFYANFYVDRLASRIVDIEGTYTPKHTKNPLNLDAKLNGLQLGVVESFLTGYFSDIGGLAFGDFKVEGTLDEPIVKGRGQIQQGKVRVDYLNTLYEFGGDFSVTENLIRLDDIRLYDVFKQEAQLKGSFSHHGFKNFEAALYGDINNFQVLSTASKDNDLFYGTGYATGDISFIGPLNKMSINANAKSEKGTKIYIPIGGSETVVQEEFINFTSLKSKKEEEKKEKEQKKNVDISGLNLNFNLDLTEDAYCEIIFDIKAGDIIRGRGNGQLKLEIDTKGDFNMFGDYTISNGGYNFTLYNIINKEFDILPDSKISWYGNPYAGILDIKAIYKQLASLAPIVNDKELRKVADLRRKYPTEVRLELNGPLLSPSIAFDIDMNNYPNTVNLPDGGGSFSLDAAVNSFKNQLVANEQEMNRQVFSLIVLRKLSPPDEAFDTGGVIGSSVSEFVSNQLSYWISQVDDNLEIDVDLGDLDPEALNTFQLRLSYTFLDGRLRVTRDGGFTNQYNETDIASIAGDWTVEYLLTPDGKFRAKMYSRTNFSTISSNQGTETRTTTGFSLLHTQSFNEIRELFDSAKQQRKRKEKEEEKQKGNIALPNKDAVLKPEDE